MRDTDRGRSCDHCGVPVVMRGEVQPEWVHLTGSVYCMATTAQVDGSSFPKAPG